MSKDIPSLYGSLVFTDKVMRDKLPKDMYKALKKTIENGTHLELDVANSVAVAMKEWAVENGATHYTHWFQPLTGITSEKHDSFIDPTDDGCAIMTFSGKELIQGEPDASSFPSGGLRATFEARGYSAWDPTSFAFIKDGSLRIPTVFCSYGGDALDKKTPLLRSMEAVSREAVRILRLFGDEQTHRVTPQVGAEQEYFLIDKALYEKREDLKFCGRTLFGAKPPKGQELDDHYFGAIRPRVAAYMQDLDRELWKLGVLSKTKHNEVAPSQHEMAPIYCDCNAANDQNQLTMEVMKKVADRHGLVCLLHEKPFAGVNGSGKHNNWSLGTDTGKNLFSPGKTPSQNAQFLLFLAAFVAGVDEYQELLRSTVAFAGNDHRLGANEAPPAIVSMFVGTELEDILTAIEHDIPYGSKEKELIKVGVHVLPKFPKDTTDRNRTSPFAFTGNKFEFRMCGSQQNLSDPNVVLNTAVAEQCERFVSYIDEYSDEDFTTAAMRFVRHTFRDHERILFDGNGYSEDWEKEAERRGLANHRTTADALPCLVDQKSIDLFTEFGVLTEDEIRSRYEVKLEKYNKIMNIEIRAMKRLVRRDYLPAINRYAAKLANGITAIKNVLPDGDTSFMKDKLEKLVAGAAEINRQLERLHELHYASLEVEDQQKRADMNAHEIIPVMDALRAAVDAMEIIVEREAWPVPTYNEILFYA